jgi:serine O-acetyltransferase
VDKEFFQRLFALQQKIEAVPPNEKIASWVSRLICLLFPERADCFSDSAEDLAENFKQLEIELVQLLNSTKACKKDDNTIKAKTFFEQIPEMYELLNNDLTALLDGDPAAHTKFEVVRAYPGFFAICFYRIAHALHDLKTPLLPRIITEWAHSATGIDIHPAAEIGHHFFIDHGTGIVVGETCIIGNHVKLYQGVTLGALSVEKSMVNVKRHPTVEDHVIIYSGATILGGDTVIGHHCIVGGNVWLTKSISPYTTVYHKAGVEIIERINV